MENFLIKYKNQGKIDFIETRLDWGRKNKEFLIYSFETKKLSRIFFDNKYREDTRKVLEEIGYYKSKFEESLKGINDIGIYNTKDDCKYYNKIIDFLVRYSVEKLSTT